MELQSWRGSLPGSGTQEEAGGPSVGEGGGVLGVGRISDLETGSLLTPVDLNSPDIIICSSDIEGGS